MNTPKYLSDTNSLVFRHNEELYIRVIPSKRLFNSTLIHEVVNRGDIFAMRFRDSMLTIIPGKVEVEFLPPCGIWHT